MPKSVLGKAIRLGAISTQFSPHPSRLGERLELRSNCSQQLYDSINVTHNFRPCSRLVSREHLESRLIDSRLDEGRSRSIGVLSINPSLFSFFFPREQNTVKFRKLDVEITFERMGAERKRHIKKSNNRKR